MKNSIQCSSCIAPKKRNSSKRVFFQSSNVFHTILLILIPKCPFCIFGYISTFMVAVYPQKEINLADQETIWISTAAVAMLCILVMAGMLVGRMRQQKTFVWAFPMVVVGSVLTVSSIGFSEYLDYPSIGLAFLLTGVYLRYAVMLFTFFRKYISARRVSTT